MNWGFREKSLNWEVSTKRSAPFGEEKKKNMLDLSYVTI